ncbi:MAG: hypothetical protein ACT4NY_12930 [Pseudonocardiales bacterium]
MMVRQLIPEGLAEMAPGPELGVLLAGIDMHAVAGSDLVEVGLCDPAAGPGEVARLTEAPPYAADEIRGALAWTRVAADQELHFAETLVTRMPGVFAALDAGRICRSKAWLFAETGLIGEQYAALAIELEALTAAVASPVTAHRTLGRIGSYGLARVDRGLQLHRLTQAVLRAQLGAKDTAPRTRKAADNLATALRLVSETESASPGTSEKCV